MWATEQWPQQRPISTNSHTLRKTTTSCATSLHPAKKSEYSQLISRGQLDHRRQIFKKSNEVTELVLLNKHQISGDGACLQCYQQRQWMLYMQIHNQQSVDQTLTLATILNSQFVTCDKLTFFMSWLIPANQQKLQIQCDIESTIFLWTFCCFVFAMLLINLYKILKSFHSVAIKS